MLRLRQGKVSQVALRTPTSIFLLSVLVAGILSPSGLCALMCERRSQAEIQQHCGHPADPMSGMVHHHSTMTSHPDIDAVMPLWTTQSCSSNCDAVERLNLSRKIVGQTRVPQTRIVAPDTTANSLAFDLGAAWRSDGGPPARRIAFAATFSILRI
jgi:hypothetical protein